MFYTSPTPERNRPRATSIHARLCICLCGCLCPCHCPYLYHTSAHPPPPARTSAGIHVHAVFSYLYTYLHRYLSPPLLTPLLFQKVERLEAKYYQVEPPKTLPRDVLDEHINRMYEATRLTEEKQKRLEAKSAYKPPKSKRITADEMADLGSRLCKPKTTDWRSHDMYGATHGM